MTSDKKTAMNVASDAQEKDELLNTLHGISSITQDTKVSDTPSGEGIFFKNRSEASDIDGDKWDDIVDFFDRRSEKPGEKTSLFQSAFFIDETPEEKDASITETLNRQKHDAFEDFNEWDLFDTDNTLATLPCIQPETPEMKKLLESSKKKEESISEPVKTGTNPGISTYKGNAQSTTPSGKPESFTPPVIPQPPTSSPKSKEEPQIITHFEGTNEIFVKSAEFDTICSEKASKSPSLPPLSESKEEPQIITHFEGTNEIFVKSAEFDTICAGTSSKANSLPPKSTGIEDPVIHHFEGTNEVFVQSKAFDKLCSSPTNSTPTEPEPEEDPVVQHFEGTNEIFIQSSVFDALCEDLDKKESTDKPEHKIQVKDHPNGLKLSVPKLTSSNSSSEESNVFGIVSSGFLPSVDIDKSFDSPCIDEETLANQANKSSSRAVFASRLSDSDQNRAVTRESRNMSAASSCGLPKIQRDNKPVFNSIRKEQTQVAINEFDEVRLLNIFNADLNEIGIQQDVEKLFELSEDVFTSETPKTFFITGGEDADRSRVIRTFLNKTNQSFPAFTCYSAASSCYSHDIVTALLSSRIGCTPDTPEPERLSKINQMCDKLFEKQDIRWGRDILYTRFGLSKFIMLQKNVQTLSARTDTDALEVLLYLVERDAHEGLVAIAISDFWLNYGQIWRDVIDHISRLKCSDILILVNAPNHIKAFQDSTSLSVSPYSQADIIEILENALSEYNLPSEMLSEISSSITPNFHGIRRALRVIQQALQTGNDVDANDFDQAFIKLLGDNERQFLGAASLLTPVFNLDDLIRVMMLQPMKDEIVWFEEKRRTWCLELTQKLVAEGELIALEKSGYYRVTEKNFIAELMLRNKMSISRYLQKAYVSVLISRNANSIEIAKACDNAGLLDKSAQYWMETLKSQIKSFSNHSADILVHYCMKLVSPDNPQMCSELMLLSLEHLYQIGKYLEVITCAETLARTGYISNDERISAEAFIWQGRAMTHTGQYAQAQQRLLYAIKLSERREDKALTSDGCYHLSVLLFESGEKAALVNALRYAEKSLEIRRKLGNLEKIAESQTICAEIYQRRGDPQRAENAANEAYQALNVSGFWHETPVCLAILSQAAASLEKPLPLDYTERGFEIVSKTGNPAHRFKLLETRIQLTMNTLQRQQVRSDLEELNGLIKQYSYLPWITKYLLLHAEFDFSRKNFKKTTKSLKLFFDAATKLKNSYLMSLGYVLSAELNFEVLKRNLSQVSTEKTKKLYITSTSIFESLGAWHSVAETLRKKAAFLEYIHETAEAEEARTRADKVDPYCQ